MVVNRNEMLRYLGHRGQIIDSHLDKLIDEAIDVVENLNYKVIFETYEIEKNENSINLVNGNLSLKGQAISSHLKAAEKVVLMAVTLGGKIEDIIRKLSYTDSTAAMIYDAAASAMVESVCQYVEDNVRVLYEGEGLFITTRFSPGYGDLDLDVQRSFLRVLEAEKKIGLHVTETNILLPRKSVTAIIGLQDTPSKKTKRKCDTCELFHTCEFAMKGEKDGSC